MKLIASKKLISGILLSVVAAGGIFVWAQNCAAEPPEIQDIGSMPVSVPDVSRQQSSNSSDSMGDMRAPFLFHAIALILWLIMKILSVLIQFAGYLVDTALTIGSFTEASVVQIGWSITRDICNIAFAIILLFMAFGTVLQVGNINYKLLPKLIGVALLINFSLVFAGIIIDFSQIMTHYFVHAASGDAGISSQLMNSLRLANIYNIGDLQTNNSIFQKAMNFVAGPTLLMITEQLFGIILMAIATFLFLIFALLLIGRIVIIWIQLIFLPLALVSWIVKIPGGEMLSWGKWKDEFFKWVFFAPIYTFFIYLALTIAQNQTFKGFTEANPYKENMEGIMVSSFYKEPWIIFQYIAVVMIMLIGLEQAKKLGGHASKLTGQMTGWANKKVKDWGTRPGKFAYDQMAPGAARKGGQLLASANIFGWKPLKKFGGRLEARAVGIQRKAEERPQHAAFKKLMTNAPSETRIYNAIKGMGPNGAIAAEMAADKDWKKMTDDEFNAIVQRLKDYNKKKEWETLQEMRPGSIKYDDKEKEKKERDEAIARARQNGNDKKWLVKDIAEENPDRPGSALLDRFEQPIHGKPRQGAEISQGAQIAKTLYDQFTTEELMDWYKKLSKQHKLAFEAAFSELLNVTTGPGKLFENDDKLRQFKENFATMTGKIAKAFTDMDGKLKESEAKIHISKMDGQAIRNTAGPDDLRLIGQYMQLKQFDGLGKGFSAEKKDYIKEGIEKDLTPEGEAKRKHISGSPAWGGKVKKKTKSPIINPATGRPYGEGEEENAIEEEEDEET